MGENRGMMEESRGRKKRREKARVLKEGKFNSEADEEKLSAEAQTWGETSKVEKTKWTRWIQWIIPGERE